MVKKIKTTTTITVTTEVVDQKISIFVALDRSGSMSGTRWNNAIEALNSYVMSAQKDNLEGNITITAFDTVGHNTHNPNTYYNAPRFVDIVSNKPISMFVPISPTTIQPEGGTPLYDASAFVMDKALASPGRSIVIILTDGEENESKEYNQSSIRAKVEQVTKLGNEVIFLGANFDISTYRNQSGLNATKSANFDLTSRSATAQMVNSLYTATASYTTAGTAMNVNSK